MLKNKILTDELDKAFKDISELNNDKYLLSRNLQNLENINMDYSKQKLSNVNIDTDNEIELSNAKNEIKLLENKLLS